MAVTAGRLGSVYAKTDDVATAMTDEATTERTTTRFQITNAVKRYIDQNTAITVKVNTVVQTSGYSIEYAGGFIVFDTSKTGTTVTITGAYWTMAVVAQLYEWKFASKMGKATCTPFGTTTGVHRIATSLDFSGSFEGYWLTDDYYRVIGTLGGTTGLTGTSLPVKLYTDASYHYEGYAILDLDVDCASDEVVKDSHSFEGDGMWYARANDT